MFENYRDLKSQIKTSKNIYSLREKLTGKGTFDIQMKKLEMNSGDTFRVLQLAFPVTNHELKSRFKQTIESLKEYQPLKSVPGLVFSDSKRIVVKWIDGTPFPKQDLKAANYLQLAKFNAANILNIEKISVNEILKKSIDQLAVITAENVIETGLQKSLLKKIEHGDIPSPDYTHEGLCFGDTALKNYMMTPENGLCYIDIMGINRRPIGRVFAKQLSQLPKEHREIYHDTFLNELNTSQVSVSLPFSHLIYLLSRLYSNVTKRTFINRSRRKKKTDRAVNEIKEFVRKVDDNENLDEWLLY